jgi:phosphatidyl-myo-inositol alpha-mannosyltransferase
MGCVINFENNNKVMKIAIFDMDDLKNPHWGSGQAKVTMEVFKRLSANHEVVVYSSKYPNYRDYVQDGIQFKHIGLDSNISKINNIIYLFVAPLIAVGVKADVIIENFTAPFSTMFIPLFTKIPVVGLTSFFAPYQLAKKYFLPFHLVTKIGMKFYKYVIALTQSQSSEVMAMNNRIRTVVIPNGIEPRYLTYPTSEKDYLLFMGRIDVHHKGIDLLFEAFNGIKDKISDQLYIMGGYDDEKNRQVVDGLMKKYNLGDRVKLLGKVMGEEKDRILSGAKIFVCPSRYESQSLSTLEAMAMSKPVVCFETRGFEWAKQDFCVKVPAFSTEEYGKALLELLNNSGLRTKLGEKARAYVTDFTWDASAGKYDEFLKSITE